MVKWIFERCVSFSAVLFDDISALVVLVQHLQSICQLSLVRTVSGVFSQTSCFVFYQYLFGVGCSFACGNTDPWLILSQDDEEEPEEEPEWDIPGVTVEAQAPVQSTPKVAVGIENRKTSIKLNKPVYVGMTVLDLSKLLMYQFWYKVLKPRYPEGKVRLCYTDTDSLILQVYTDDVYDDMKQNLDEYDTSNYPPEHKTYSTANKKVVGKMKDELGGKVMTEFVGLRSKMYSYVGEESGKRAKGVKKTVLRNTVCHEDYKACLLNQAECSRQMPGLRSHSHRIYGETVTKIALSPLDTKRYILADGITTLAFGHKDIPTQTQDTPMEVGAPIQPPTLDFCIPQLYF